MKQKMVAISVFAILLLSSAIAVSEPATESNERGKPQPAQDMVKIWEAYAKGWVKITSENYTHPSGWTSNLTFRVNNTENVIVNINEMAMLLSPHPLQTGNPQTTQDGALTTALVDPNTVVDFYYGDYTVPGSPFPELIGEKPWWCTERRQVTQEGAPIVLGGEIMPAALQELVKNPDWNTNARIWNYLYEHPTLVVGKTPLWKEIPDATNEYIDITIAVTNLAIYIDNGTYIPHARNSIIEDIIPKEYSFDPGSFDPTPDVIIENMDGTKTIRWKVDVDAADVTYHFNDYDPTPYDTVFLNYTLITPELKAGRYFLERAWADVNRDGTNDSHSARPLLEVYRVNKPPVPDAGGPYEVDEGSDTLLDASGSLDPNGDPLSYRWDLDADGIWDTSWSSSPTYPITCPDGPYETDIIVEATDGELSASATTHYQCNNVPPTIDTVSIQLTFTGNTQHMSPANLHEAEAFSVFVTFSDPGWLDTHEALIDWRDGQSTAPPIIEENDRPDATGNFTDNHIYGDDFDLGFQITVVDDDGDADVEDVPLDVLNLDPVIDGLTYSLTVLEPRTVGYWNHQCNITEPYGDHTGITDDLMLFINSHSQVFKDVDTEEEVCSYLADIDFSSMREKALRQLMALWLNTASGKLNFTTMVRLPGQNVTTLGDILAWSESMLLGSANESELETVKTVCDEINNGMHIAIGEILLSTDVHDPGSDDIIFSVDWGDGSSGTETFYNDGLAPDPPNSPLGNYPFDVHILARHDYWAEGSYSIIIGISDDDGGQTLYYLDINVYAP